MIKIIVEGGVVLEVIDEKGKPVEYELEDHDLKED